MIDCHEEFILSPSLLRRSATPKPSFLKKQKVWWEVFLAIVSIDWFLDSLHLSATMNDGLMDWSLCANVCVTHVCMPCPSSSFSKLWYIFQEEQPENGTINIYINIYTTDPPYIHICINFILKRFRVSFWSSLADLRTRTLKPSDDKEVNLSSSDFICLQWLYLIS